MHLVCVVHRRAPPHASTFPCVTKGVRHMCHGCRTDLDFKLLTRRIVDVETNSLFVTFHRPDLKLSPAAAADAAALLPPDKKIKGVDYGRPAHVHGEYRAPGFKACAEDRTLPTPTMIITDSKAECKVMHAKLLKRPDYQALMYTHEQARVPFKFAADNRAYGAKEAYAFRCCSHPHLLPDNACPSVCHSCML